MVAFIYDNESNEINYDLGIQDIDYFFREQ